MKKLYIQPEVEISSCALNMPILQISMTIDDKPGGDAGGEDGGEGSEGDVNKINLWEE